MHIYYQDLNLYKNLRKFISGHIGLPASACHSSAHLPCILARAALAKVRSIARVF